MFFYDYNDPSSRIIYSPKAITYNNFCTQWLICSQKFRLFFFKVNILIQKKVTAADLSLGT